MTDHIRRQQHVLENNNSTTGYLEREQHNISTLVGSVKNMNESDSDTKFKNGY